MRFDAQNHATTERITFTHDMVFTQVNVLSSECLSSVAFCCIVHDIVYHGIS